MSSPTIRSSRVTAALIPFQDRIFIAQRPPHKKFGLLWEFPGGKVEQGESLAESLAREIREELCWQVDVGSLFERVHCRLLDLSIELYAFWCSIRGGELCLKEHVAYRWVQAAELEKYGFTEADRQLVSSLQRLPAFPQANTQETLATTYINGSHPFK